MQTRRLGRTGHESSLAVLGGIVFHFLDEDTAGGTLHRALDRGVNHLDIAPGYFSAEETVGPHIPAVRDRLFIGEKSGKTTRDEVRRQLERSLGRLGIDRVDLYQLHGVTDLDDLDGREDAVRALTEARDEGLCRWIGITGHNVGTPVAQREALRRYDLDTVMFPIYPRLWADADYRRDAEGLLAEASARDVGVLVIKSGAARPWPAPGAGSPESGIVRAGAAERDHLVRAAAHGRPRRARGALRPVHCGGHRDLHARRPAGVRVGPGRRRGLRATDRSGAGGRDGRRPRRRADLPHPGLSETSPAGTQPTISRDQPARERRRASIV